MERALDAWTPPPARSEFRQSVHDSFVRAGSSPEELERELKGPLDAWREPKPPARFRERVRRALVRGETSRKQHRGPPRAARTSSLLRHRWLPWVAGCVAAAGLVLAFVASRDRALAPFWRLAPESGVPDGLVVDGIAFQAVRTVELERALARANTVTMDGGTLRLVFGELFLLEIEGAAGLDLSRVLRDHESEMALSADHGGFRVATGPGFVGAARLTFETPHVVVTADGTVFGVDVFPEQGTCVCCTENAVQVASRSLPSDVRQVEAGQTDFVHVDGSHSLKPIFSGHEPGLKALHGAWR